MYGISNSQQQGGGGGGAASYKAIKATLTPSDWQEVPKQAFFVGEDAMQWPIDDTFSSHAKRSNDIIGLTSGVDYTMSVTVDGQVYTKTAQMADPSQTGGMKVLIFYFAGVGEDGSIINEDELIAVQIYDDVAAMMSGVSSLAIIAAPETVTSFVITSFTGIDFGSSGKATISDSAIKVNSAVTLYTNTSEKIAVGEKTNGNVTLIAPSIPTTEISYSLEIVGTDTEGLFELVNGYIPEIPAIPDTPSGAPQWHTIYEDTTGTGAVSVELSEPLQAGGLYRITLGGSVFMFCFPDAGDITQFSISREDFQDANTMGHRTYNFEHYKTSSSLECHYLAQYTITADGVSNISFADNTTIQALKITKVEVYR